MAVLFSMELHFLGHNVEYLYTYGFSFFYNFGLFFIYFFLLGSPRVGNEVFAKTFDGIIPSWSKKKKKLFLIYFSLISSKGVTHWRDVVPHLPLLAMDFYHIATEVWYSEPFVLIKVCDGSGEDPTCSDSLQIDLSVSDHLNYFNHSMGGCSTVETIKTNKIY